MEANYRDALIRKNLVEDLPCILSLAPKMDQLNKTIIVFVINKTKPAKLALAPVPG